MTGPPQSATRQRLQFIAWMLDRMIPVPGTRMGIGLDGLIGLIPGLGDALGALMSSYILAEAVKLNVPRTVLLRIGFNIAIDSLLGAIPILGDLFDLVWQANQRNVRLLDAYLDNPRRTRSASRWWLWGFAALVLAFVASVLVLGYWLLQALIRML
ncbi:MAG: DUF4112 domain-containing protein [Candidatus Competibacterales bacterium]|nr:DUF4112 domain-containing protein [Candidatus Competibacterales bacterium]